MSKALDDIRENIHYFDFKRHWTKRIQPNLSDAEYNRVLIRDFGKWTGQWNKPFGPGMYPEAFDCCDWRLDLRGRPARLLSYVCHGACHWLVNSTLRLAMLTVPDDHWRIVRSSEHSTVWNGGYMLFDLNFYGLGIPAIECFDLAYKRGRVMPLGAYIQVGTPDWSRIEARNKALYGKKAS